MNYDYIKRKKQYQSSLKKSNKRPIIQKNNSQSEQNIMYSDNSDDRNEYLDKIQSIWKNIKKTKNMSAQKSSQSQNSSDEENDTISYQQNKLFNTNTIQQQFDLAKCQQNIQILMKKLISAEEQIQYLEFQLDKQINSNDLLKKQLKKLKNKLQFQQKQNQINQINVNHKNQQDFEFQQEKDKRTIEKLEFKIKALLKEVDVKDQSINQLAKDNQKLQMINYNKNSGVTETYQNHNFKGSEILQLNQAYRTIQRLATLLKSTQQYKSIGNLAQQFKSIHFLNNIPKRLKQSSLNLRLNSKNKLNNNVCNCMQIRINQKLLWTPMLCYKKMLQMKLKYDSLSEDCIQQVLFEINRLYTSKQQTRVAKIKSFYENQIIKLKKKTQLTYDQILAKKQIERLKKELTSKKKGIKINGQKKVSVMQDQSQIKQSGKYQKLRAIGQYEDELKLKQRQIKLLQERIKLFESQTTTYNKNLYMQGVIWIIDKLLQQLDLNNESVKDFQNKFRRKINMTKSPQEWIRSYKQLFESIQQINHTLIEKILTIKETTIKKMNA